MAHRLWVHTSCPAPSRLLSVWCLGFRVLRLKPGVWSMVFGLGVGLGSGLGLGSGSGSGSNFENFGSKI